MLSIILLSYNSSKMLPDLVSETAERMQTEGIDFELIIMDDGSKDNSYAIAKRLEDTCQNVRAFTLSRNYTSPYSLFAGLKVAKGDCATHMVDDGQIPMDVIIAMYKEWKKGHKVIFCNRASRSDGFLTNLFAKWYYSVMNKYSLVKFPDGGTDGMLIDREVIDIINNELKTNSTTPIMEVLKLGFDPLFIPFDRPAHIGKSRWTLSKKLRLAADTFFSASSLPIRFITFLGFGIFTLSFILTLFIIGLKIFSDSTLFGLPVPGWATLIVLICLFNGLILFSLGIVAEYIWRIYELSKGTPPFIIRKEETKPQEPIKEDHL